MKTPHIQTSENYNDFSFIIGNRNINENKVNKIIKDIKNGLNLLPYYPIMVCKIKGLYQIIDGQHRFNVAKNIKSPVYFIETNELNLKQVASLNSRQDKWTQTDFLRCYVKLGVKDYVVLRDFQKIYSVGLSTCATLLMTNKIANRAEVGEKFRDGEFKVNHLKSTKDLFELSHSLFDMYKFYTDRNLIDAVQKLSKKGLCDFDVLRRKLKAAPMLMDKHGTSKDYIYNIEKVYNYRNSQRQRIF